MTERRGKDGVSSVFPVLLSDAPSLRKQVKFAAYRGRATSGIRVSRKAKYFGREESTFVRGVLRLEEPQTTDTVLRGDAARLAGRLQTR